ncbi:MAG: hypothetical protein HYR80_05455 [Nitrospirae bacterium]|nr:hypothetical protein [Nitrospirota bacterium]
MNSLNFEMQEIEKKLEVLAEGLSEGRKSAIVTLEKEVVKDLKTLKIKDPEFKVRFLNLPSEIRFTRHGQEEVVFLISMNPGFPPIEIEKAASGGELSRLMLVLKSILSQAESVPLLIFDEIDTGVGGEVAELIGKKLWNLARTKQVFCITHLPQIACFGEFHFNISKRVKRGKTDVVVKRLNDRERIQEIGRMLGGSIMTSNTIKFAEEMMANRLTSPRSSS